ncbi:MAG TPA: hypothetical protein VGV39_04755 [Mesorhizobium sp.]|uniref:hypothetical protein n=1 Tax=Mesorhizobium sp. TaxID=1871066 RepID=UPI002DDD8014|nr:hypothetical protein [Mesorhizobium sp.]HEV2502359.1 hypothetical protein [Mesorhizobium sp.]
MKLPRLTSDDERNDLKAVTRQALQIARPTKFALVTRADAPTLSNYGSPDHPLFMPIDVAVELCRDVGTPVIIEEMARLCGFKLVPLEPDEGGTITLDDVSRTLKETSEAVTSLADFAQGKPGAARAAIREIDEGLAALNRVRRKVVAA